MNYFVKTSTANDDLHVFGNLIVLFWHAYKSSLLLIPIADVLYTLVESSLRFKFSIDIFSRLILIGEHKLTNSEFVNMIIVSCSFELIPCHL